MFELTQGDCLEILLGMATNSVDAIVTDPPYELGFMAKSWDKTGIANDPFMWAEALRVLKPGGHLASFSSTRTYHRMACAIEDAGFEVRDQLAWVYGQGFPKSLDVSKAIDKAAGAERVVVGSKLGQPGYSLANNVDAEWGGLRGDAAAECAITAPATDAARQWNGWGTALKPSYEPICLAQKPYTPQQFLAIMVPTIGELLCRVASSEMTGTSQSALGLTNGFLSIALLLSDCLAELWGQESKFTTETASALTTDLKILKSLLSTIMQGTTTGEAIPTNGGASNAYVAETISRSVLAKCERLRSTTAGEIAIDWLAQEGTSPEGAKFSPNWEPICLARKPLSEKTVAANVLRWGTGAINVGACKIGTADYLNGGRYSDNKIGDDGATYGAGINKRSALDYAQPSGRFPANLCHDGSDEVLDLFPETKSGNLLTHHRLAESENGSMSGKNYARSPSHDMGGDSGSAARFFYCAKASKGDRAGSKHPTVKPIKLMQWLCRLITPPGGVVLDPFAGSGTTGAAAILEGFRPILIEREDEYVADIRRRLGLHGASDAVITHDTLGEVA